MVIDVVKRQLEIDKMANILLKLSHEDGRLDGFCYGDERILAELLVDNGIGTKDRFTHIMTQVEPIGDFDTMFKVDIQPIDYKPKITVTMATSPCCNGAITVKLNKEGEWCMVCGKKIQPIDYKE